jgi:hypothetical protein
MLTRSYSGPDVRMGEMRSDCERSRSDLLEPRFWIVAESTIRESIGSVYTCAFIVIDLGRQTSSVGLLRIIGNC